jgi:hypothetical protein
MLEHELRELRVQWPATPDIAGSLVLAPPPPARRWTLARPAWQIAVAVVALLVAIAMAVPPTRAAVLDLLGLSSTVRIERREPVVSRFASGLQLGEPVSLETARRKAGFPVRVPAAVGRPDSVYLGENPARVDLVYRPRPDLPRASATGAGLLVTELRATVTPAIQKTIGSATHFERLEIGGDQAYFFSGREHGFAYEPPNGVMGFESQRLAGNTLLVERGDGMLLRIEGRISRDQAVRIAESAR